MAAHRTEDDDLHTVAETFLREYLAETGSKPMNAELASTSRCTARHVAESRMAARDFIRQLRKDRQQAKQEGSDATAERYEIEYPQRVVLSRRCGTVITFSYGWKQNRPLLVHAVHLALALDADDGEKLSILLREHEIETFPMPAPALGNSSF